MKLIMREFCNEEGKIAIGWDDPVPPHTVEKFHKIIEGMGELKKVSFPRSIRPCKEVKGQPVLMMFGDVYF